MRRFASMTLSPQLRVGSEGGGAVRLSESGNAELSSSPLGFKLDAKSVFDVVTIALRRQDLHILPPNQWARTRLVSVIVNVQCNTLAVSGAHSGQTCRQLTLNVRHHVHTSAAALSLEALQGALQRGLGGDVNDNNDRLVARLQNLIDLLEGGPLARQLAFVDRVVALRKVIGHKHRCGFAGSRDAGQKDDAIPVGHWPMGEQPAQLFRGKDSGRVVNGSVVAIARFFRGAVCVEGFLEKIGANVAPTERIGSRGVDVDVLFGSGLSGSDRVLLNPGSIWFSKGHAMNRLHGSRQLCGRLSRPQQRLGRPAEPTSSEQSFGIRAQRNVLGSRQ